MGRPKQPEAREPILLDPDFRRNLQRPRIPGKTGPPHFEFKE
jgi:hypothetical protein